MFLVRILLFFTPWAAFAADLPQDLQLLRRLGNTWLQRQAALAWPDIQAQAQTGAADERLRLPSCRELVFVLPPGARLGNAGSLQAQCTAPAKWSLYLDYHLHLSGPALVASRDLPARTLLDGRDMELRDIEFEQTPSAYLNNPRLAIGMRSAQPVRAGQPLLAASLSRPPVINAGQHVRIFVRGVGFSVNQDGNALNTAATGETVRAKTHGGRSVQGIAQEDGSILVQP